LRFAAANVVAALAFGAGHLPMAAQVFGGLTTMVVVRTIALNALGGIVFGSLYSRWGLERAMVAHFCADIVLHVVLGA
jgi:membrane protease YdiL (CAAX protease family)